MSIPVYTPNGWVDDDGSGTVGTPYTAARMTHIEEGVRDARIMPAVIPPAADADGNRVVWRRASDGSLVADHITYASDVGSNRYSENHLRAYGEGTGNAYVILEAYQGDPALGRSGQLQVASIPTNTEGKRGLWASLANDSNDGSGFLYKLIDSAKDSDFATSKGSFKVGLSGSGVTVTTSNILVTYTDKSSWGGFDHDNWWDSTNFRFNPKRSGYYVFAGAWRIAGTPASGNGIWVNIFKNGSFLLAASPGLPMSGAANPGGPFVSPPILMNGSTDYVDVRMNTNSSSFSLSIDPSTNWFSGHYMGR